MIDQAHAVYTQINNVVGTLNVLYAIAEVDPDHPSGQTRQHGRVRDAQHRHRGGLARSHPQRPHRHRPVPQAARLLLPPLEGPRQPQHRVRLPSLEPAGHRLEPGHRLRPGDRRDASRSSAWRRGSTTTPCSGRSSTGWSSRPCAATRSPSTAAAARSGGCSTSATRSSASAWPRSTRPKPGEFRVFNQFTEQFSVLEIAEMIRASYPGPVRIARIDNPRVEAAEHYYHAEHSRLADLGLEPHLLNDTLIESLFAIAIRHRRRADSRLFAPSVQWTATSNRSGQIRSERPPPDPHGWAGDRMTVRRCPLTESLSSCFLGRS